MKAFLIRGGSKKDREKKVKELYTQDIASAFVILEGKKNETVIVFRDASEPSLIDMTFEQAKKLAGNEILPPDFKTTWNSVEQYGIFDMSSKAMIAEMSRQRENAAIQKKKHKELIDNLNGNDIFPAFFS